MAASLIVQEKAPEAESGASGAPALIVSGRLDASTVSILEHALTRAFARNARSIVVDLADVNYISSSGLRVLLTARRKTRERGGDLILCDLSRNVRDVFDMVGFTALFTLAGTLAEAMQAARDPGAAGPPD
jgi:anti-sigma B factor antagonist